MIIDFIAGVCGEDAEGGGAQNLKALKLLRILRFAKLMRLLKIGKILSSLDRTLVDMIEDFFMNATTRMIIQLASLTLFCGFFGHLLACVWVFVGRTADAQNIDSWCVRTPPLPFLLLRANIHFPAMMRPIAHPHAIDTLTFAPTRLLTAHEPTFRSQTPHRGTFVF
jgi:hypothetical protein